MSAAAFDYEGLRADTVVTLIDRFGRDFVLNRAARPTTATADPAKPWLSTTKGDKDTAAASAQSIGPQKGVFLSLERRDREGQVIEAKTQGLIFAADDDFPEELGPDWQVVDGTRVWEVIESKPLRPGPTFMIYRLELAL